VNGETDALVIRTHPQGDVVKLFNTTKKKIAAGAAAAALVASTGIAAAYWTQGGTGTGAATAGDTVAVEIVQTSTVTGLYPGGTPVGLSGTIDNPNAHEVTVAEITAVVSDVTDEGTDAGLPACTTDDFAIAGTSGPYVADADDSTTWSGLTVAMVDGTGNQDNCKGASIEVTYTANGVA
jgi:hypothetical protein